MKWLERLDNSYHKYGWPGGWVVCDLWDAYSTREYRSILTARFYVLKTQVGKVVSVFSRRRGQ